MNADKAKLLIEKYLNGDCTPEEKLLLERFYLEQKLKIEINEALINPDEIKKEIWERIGCFVAPVRIVKYRLLKVWISAAAAILILFLGGFYFYRGFNNKVALVTAKPYKISTGGNKAMLTLADGSNIVLNDVKNGPLARQGASAVQKSKDGLLVYEQTGAPLANNHAEPIYNTLTIPKGGQYRLVLPDGTRIWLNAATVLKFPAAFTGKQRMVELNGEAYFEVAKNKAKPFVVKSGDHEVRVLGTHFNVNSYNNENAVATTLLEGRVQILAGDRLAILNPGQQSVFDASKKQITVKRADPEEAVAWKNGYFVFNKEPVESIMRKISRWYDVDITYKGGIDKKAFGGTVSRFTAIEDVLDMLQSTGSLHFKIDGRRVIVMP